MDPFAKGLLIGFAAMAALTPVAWWGTRPIADWRAGKLDVDLALQRQRLRLAIVGPVVVLPVSALFLLGGGLGSPASWGWALGLLFAAAVFTPTVLLWWPRRMWAIQDGGGFERAVARRRQRSGD